MAYRLATGAFQPQPPWLVSSNFLMPEASQILITTSLTAFTSSMVEPVARQPLKCPLSCGLTLGKNLACLTEGQDRTFVRLEV